MVALKKLDRFFGERLFSFQAFYTCWFLSLIYSISLFLLAWLFAGDGMLGNIKLMPDNLEWYKRAFTIFLIILYVFIVFITFKNFR